MTVEGKISSEEEFKAWKLRKRSKFATPSGKGNREVEEGTPPMEGAKAPSSTKEDTPERGREHGGRTRRYMESLLPQRSGGSTPGSQDGNYKAFGDVETRSTWKGSAFPEYGQRHHERGVVVRERGFGRELSLSTRKCAIRRQRRSVFWRASHL